MNLNSNLSVFMQVTFVIVWKARVQTDINKFRYVIITVYCCCGNLPIQLSGAYCDMHTLTNSLFWSNQYNRIYNQSSGVVWFILVGILWHTLMDVCPLRASIHWRLFLSHKQWTCAVKTPFELWTQTKWPVIPHCPLETHVCLYTHDTRQSTHKDAECACKDAALFKELFRSNVHMYISCSAKWHNWQTSVVTAFMCSMCFR